MAKHESPERMAPSGDSPNDEDFADQKLHHPQQYLHK
jgi:hypothetical protein